MFKLLLITALLLKNVILADVSYYEILGVSKTASAQEIRQAYKKLAIKFHPDKNPDSSEQEKFLKITEAYETLKDPDKRHKYDVYGSYPSYTRRYDHKSEAEYNNLFYNGLYHDDPFVDTLSSGSFYTYLQDGFHFINFYSPFCPPCQNLVDHWKKLAEIYKGVVKIAAVNCKYYSNFCYNSMRIGSYPSLLFYPNGKKGSYIYYRGDRTIDALDSFIISYLRNHVTIPVITKIRHTDKPMAYILGHNRIGEDSLIRIAYQLKGLVLLATVEDDDLRYKLTKDDSTTVVFKFKSTTTEIDSTEEKEILNEIVTSLPKVELVEPEKLKKIRNQLRSGTKTPWVLYFSTKENDRDRLILYQVSVAHPEMNFGEIDCDSWNELCTSLQVEEPPGWAVLKQGGAYQRVPRASDAILASKATNLHSLSASEFQRILGSETGTWVLAVVPYKLSWDHILEPFTEASRHFDHEDINFGLMICSVTTDKYCRHVVSEEPGVVVQMDGRTHHYTGDIDERQIVEFIELIRNSADMELNEQQLYEIMDASMRSHTWLVGYFPAQCGRACDGPLHEWRLVANKLRPLSFVRVGLLQCSHYGREGICSNVRAITARLYPFASRQHYTVNLQHLGQAPYMWEWALEYIDDSVLKFNWQTFSKHVLSEELNPSSGRKPWLVYFHSPRCYRCYEMYADFAIAGIMLNNAVQLGKVNCVNERSLCQQEQVPSYPTLRLYLGRNHQHRFSTFMPIQLRDYQSMLNEIEPHIRKYDPKLLSNFQGSRVHDEF